jgi:hypothetical protein
MVCIFVSNDEAVNAMAALKAALNPLRSRMSIRDRKD